MQAVRGSQIPYTVNDHGRPTSVITTTLVTVDEALRMLGWDPVKRDSLYRRVRLGQIPGAVRIGRNVYFSPELLRGWIAGGSTNA